jgi:hypothetical protein
LKHDIGKEDFPLRNICAATRHVHAYNKSWHAPSTKGPGDEIMAWVLRHIDIYFNGTALLPDFGGHAFGELAREDTGEPGHDCRGTNTVNESPERRCSEDCTGYMRMTTFAPLPENDETRRSEENEVVRQSPQVIKASSHAETQLKYLNEPRRLKDVQRCEPKQCMNAKATDDVAAGAAAAVIGVPQTSVDRNWEDHEFSFENREESVEKPACDIAEVPVLESRHDDAEELENVEKAQSTHEKSIEGHEGHGVMSMSFHDYVHERVLALNQIARDYKEQPSTHRSSTSTLLGQQLEPIGEEVSRPEDTEISLPGSENLMLGTGKLVYSQLGTMNSVQESARESRPEACASVPRKNVKKARIEMILAKNGMPSPGTENHFDT